MQYGSVKALLFVKVNFFLTNRQGREGRKEEKEEKCLTELYCVLMHNTSNFSVVQRTAIAQFYKICIT